MISPEQLITNLIEKIVRLEKELEEAQKDIKDFEVLAVEWKKGYSELKRKHNIELGNAKKTIEELEDELKETKNPYYENY